jgi:uncharacterized membrane protein YhaH (DUF805 family)
LSKAQSEEKSPDGALKWADDLTRTGLKRMGEVTLELLKQPDRWVHRRVERIEFKDHKTARHQISVDLTLPDNLTSVGTFKCNRIYIAPVAMLLKDYPRRVYDASGRAIPMAPYFDIDYADQTGGRLPLPTRRQATRIAAVALEECASQAVAGELPPQLAARIRRLAVANTAHYAPDLHYIMEPNPSDKPRKELQEDPDFKQLAYLLASHSIVFCYFTNGLPGRTILKITYDQETNGGPTKWHERFRRGMGWKSEIYYVPLNEVGAAASYHVEIAVPHELLLNEIGLEAKSYDVGWRGMPLQVTRQPNDYYIRQRGDTCSANIYISEPDSRRIGAAWVKLRVARAGFLIGTLVASIITTTVLTLAALAAPTIAEKEPPDAAVAVLLLIPTLLAAYVARPGEHAITARMLRSVRLLLVADGVLPFLAAFFLMIVSKEDSDQLEEIWWILAVVSVVFVLLFLASNIFPKPHGKPRYYTGT